MSTPHTAGRRLGIAVQLACNTANGLFSGYLPALQLGKSGSVHLEAMWWDEDLQDFIGPKCQLVIERRSQRRTRGWFPMRCRGYLQIERRRFRIVAHQAHVGNLRWDMVVLRHKECLRMLKWLRRKGWYDCSEAPTEWFDLWRSRGELKPKHFFLL